MKKQEPMALGKGEVRPLSYSDASLSKMRVPLRKGSPEAAQSEVLKKTSVEAAGAAYDTKGDYYNSPQLNDKKIVFNRKQSAAVPPMPAITVTGPKSPVEIPAVWGKIDVPQPHITQGDKVIQEKKSTAVATPNLRTEEKKEAPKKEEAKKEAPKKEEAKK
jgi:hypothetical protein